MSLVPISFGVVAPNNIATRQYFRDTEERLKKDDFLKNPFKAKIKRISNKHRFKDEYYFSLRPVYPQFWLLFLFPLIIAFLPVWEWIRISALLVSGGICCSVVLWSYDFHYNIMKLGAKKQNISTKKWELIRQNEAVERLI